MSDDLNEIHLAKLYAKVATACIDSGLKPTTIRFQGDNVSSEAMLIVRFFDPENKADKPLALDFRGTGEAKPGFTVVEAIEGHAELRTAPLRACLVIAEPLDRPGQALLTVSNLDEAFKAILVNAVGALVQPPPRAAPGKKLLS